MIQECAHLLPPPSIVCVCVCVCECVCVCVCVREREYTLCVCVRERESIRHGVIQVYHIERGLVEVDSVLGGHVLDKPCHYFAHAVLMHTLTAAFVSAIKEP